MEPPYETPAPTPCWEPVDEPPEPCAISDAAPDDVGEIESPSDGAVVRSTWAPLSVALGDGRAGGTVRTCLDGVQLDDPLGIVRRRTSSFGGGFDYLATLLLADVEPGEHDLVVEWTATTAPACCPRAPSPGIGHPTAWTSTWWTSWGPPRGRGWWSPTATSSSTSGPPTTRPRIPTSATCTSTASSSSAGRGTVYLDPGPLRLLAVRSLLDELTIAELELDADELLPLQLTRSVHLADHVSADLHVHTGRSYDSHVPDHVRLTSLVAADLDVAVITDHGKINELTPLLDSLAGPAPVPTRLVAGIEADIRDYSRTAWDIGHLNAFPVVGGDVAPIPSDQPDTVAGYLDTWRARQHDHPHPHSGPDLHLQLNHPRGIHFVPDELPKRGAWPMFNALDFDPTLPLTDPVNAALVEPEPGTGTTALDFDSVEVVNRFSLDLFLELREDWFRPARPGGLAHRHRQQRQPRPAGGGGRAHRQLGAGAEARSAPAPRHGHLPRQPARG